MNDNKLDIDLNQLTALELNPLTQEEWDEDERRFREFRRARAEQPFDAQEWNWKFGFLAKIRLEILENEKLTIDELVEISEHQLAELMVWFLGLPQEEQSRHAVRLKATLMEVMKLKELNRQKALMLLKRDWGIDEEQAMEMAEAMA